MKIEQKSLDMCEVELTVEVDNDQVELVKRAAARKLAQKYTIPGFRKGKAPYDVVLRNLGEGAVMEEAIEELGQTIYKTGIEEAKLDPVAPGELVDVKLNPLVFVFKVSLQPEVDLGSYRSVRLGYVEPEVTAEALNETLEHLREHQAVLEPVERPAEMGDVLTLDLRGVAKLPAPSQPADSPLDPAAQTETSEPEDEFLMDDKDVELLLDPKLEYPAPGFAEKIVGVAAGEERRVELEFPDDYANEELRGRETRFEVKCSSVKKRTLPEWDDELAKSIGDYESLADLRAKVQEELLAMAKRQADEEYAKRALDTVVAGAAVKFPPALLEQEVDDMVTDLDRRLHEQKLTVNDYLRIQNLTEAKLRTDLQPHARERLRRSLTLGKVIAQEGIAVGDDEIAAHIEQLVSSFGAEAEKFKKLLNSESGRRSLRFDLLSQKAVERLKAIARGENPPLPETQAEAEEKKAAPESQVETT